MKKIFILFLFFSIVSIAHSQTIMETGGKKMPDEWIDKDTGHKVIKLTRREGVNMSFYFHNNPFVDNKMIFCGGNRVGKPADIPGKEIYNLDVKDLQMFWVDLKTLKVDQLTHETSPVHSEIVCTKTKEIFFQIKDSVFCVNMQMGKRRLVYVFPENAKSSITTVNADGSLLGGAFSTPEEAEIFKKYPKKSDFFDRVYDAKLPRTLFTINTKTGELKRIFTDNAWLNHIQFSSVDPHLLMFCHEGPWHKVDRIWTIDVVGKNKPTLIHKRTMDMEIAGHEWFGSSGKSIYFDLQKPRGQKFFVAKVDLPTGKEISYELQRNEWSVHYTSSWGEKLLAGDGGDANSVAKASDGKWIYLFHMNGNKLTSTKLVNMKNHNYSLEPNVHFSPDNRWIIFRANFEGQENVYAVEIVSHKIN